MPPRTLDGTRVGGDAKELVDPVYSDRRPVVSLVPVGGDCPFDPEAPVWLAAFACCLAAARSFASVNARLCRRTWPPEWPPRRAGLALAFGGLV
jgi:hypothetical protein